MTQSGNLLHGSPARRRLVAGARLAADAVGATLGPGGRTVLIERGWAAPVATKDGVTVAREIALDDRHAHMGAMFALEASRRTVNAAGDGTTATAVLVGELASRGEKLRAAGMHPLDLARGMRGAATDIIAELRHMARPVDETEDIRRVALLAANGHENVARAVAEALEAVGIHGVVSIARSKRSDPVTMERSSGLWFDRGWSSCPNLLRTDEAADGCIRIERPLVLVCDDAIMNAHGAVSLMEAALRTIKRWKDGQTGAHGSFGGLLFVARVEGDARSTIVQNRHNGQLDAVFVLPPWSAGGTAEALEDIAVATGASVIGTKVGRPAPDQLSEAAVSVGLESLGVASRAEIRSQRTVIELASIGLRGEDLDARTSDRLAQISAARERAEAAGQAHTADQIGLRASRLGGGTVTLAVGGTTETEAAERAFRVEDALCASRAAIAGGVLAGSGAALWCAALRVRTRDRGRADFTDGTDEAAGRRLTLEACAAPLRRLAENAGDDGLRVCRRMADQATGTAWNAATREFCDAWDAGIMDPLEVVVNEIRNAVSAAASMMEAEVSVHPIAGRDVTVKG